MFLNSFLNFLARVIFNVQFSTLTFPLLFSQHPNQTKQNFLGKVTVSHPFPSPSNTMNSRELALVSTATVFGALASALAFRFFLSPKKHFPQTNPSQNGVVSQNRSSRSPFDPSKRTGSVYKFCLLVSQVVLF